MGAGLGCGHPVRYLALEKGITGHVLPVKGVIACNASIAHTCLMEVAGGRSGRRVRCKWPSEKEEKHTQGLRTLLTLKVTLGTVSPSFEYIATEPMRPILYKKASKGRD